MRRGATRRTSRDRTTSPAAASPRGCRSSRGPPAARTPSSSTARSARCEVHHVLGCFPTICRSPRKIQGKRTSWCWNVGLMDGRFQGNPFAAAEILLAKAHVLDVPGCQLFKLSTRILNDR